jgi:hypothetical protein
MPQTAPASALRRVASPTTICLLATVSLLLILGYTWGPVSLLVAPVFAAALTALCIKDRVAAGIVAFVAGLAGTALAAHLFALAPYVTTVTYLTGPAIENAQDFAYVNVLFNVIRHSGPNAASAALGSTVTAALLVAALTGGLALGLCRLLESRPSAAPVVAWLAVGMLTASFVYTGAMTSRFLVGSLDRPPAAGSYRYDGDIYFSTLTHMGGGNGYYAAVVKAVAEDSRSQGRWVRDGRIVGLPSALGIREPYLFYFWRLILFGDGRAVLWAALLLAAAGLPAVFVAARPYLRYRALFVAALLAPFLLLGVTWDNLFMPDLWAGLFLLFGVAALLMKRHTAAGLLMFAAALAREVILVWLVVMAAVALARWALRREEGATVRKMAVLYSALALGFLPFFGAHLVLASKVMGLTGQEQRTQALGLVSHALAQPVLTKLAGPLSYLTLPYRLLGATPIWVPLAAIAGFWFVLRKAPEVRPYAVAFPVFWLLYYAAIGASSGYWGQQTMPVFLLGAGMAIAGLDGIVALAWTRIRRGRAVQGVKDRPVIG